MALSGADKLSRIGRFYQTVSVEPRADGHAVLLDGRQAKTAAAKPLTAPTPALAALWAAEWDAQVEFIEFSAMPANRLAFTAIDRVSETHAALAAEVARYAATDVICYPVEHPRALAARQAAAWGPWRTWAADELGLEFHPAQGLLHHAQPAETLAGVERLASELDGFTLTALAFATALYGSAILALAVQRGALDAVAAFELSRLEEAFQSEQWGQDPEAEARTAALRLEAEMVGRWFAALG